MNKDIFSQQVLREMIEMKAIIINTNGHIQYLEKKIDKMDLKLSINEKIDPYMLYKARDLVYILKKGKNTVNELLKTGEIPADKLSGAGGYKIKGADLLEYIERNRLAAVQPNAAS